MELGFSWFVVEYKSNLKRILFFFGGGRGLLPKTQGKLWLTNDKELRWGVMGHLSVIKKKISFFFRVKHTCDYLRINYININKKSITHHYYVLLHTTLMWLIFEGINFLRLARILAIFAKLNPRENFGNHWLWKLKKKVLFAFFIFE